MKLSVLILALFYELGLLLLDRSPALLTNSWFRRMMANCRPSWTEWKTAQVMKNVDEQSKKLVEYWAEDQRTAMANKLAKKAKRQFPDAKITPVPNAAVPSVIIEEENGDTALGGPMRITWRLDDD